MKLKVSCVEGAHKETVSACAWTPSNELITVSDDKSIQKWGIDGESKGQVCEIDAFVTDLDYSPTGDLFVVSCTDGSYRLMSTLGREEKKVEASPAGAIICIRWNYKGDAIVTAGEDGTVKVWSRTGMLRSTIATCAKPVYAVCWSPDSDSLLYATGRELIIKSLQVEKKQVAWKAHKGVVMCMDWNAVTGLIVSGGEDRRYCVWDAFGRQLFESAPLEYVVTSVKWSPPGDLFAVGAYNILRLCDKCGWSHSRDRPASGSIYDLSWTPDGTQVAGAGGAGSVVYAEIVGLQLSWKSVEVMLTTPNHLRVVDSLNETVEELDFRERVVEVSLGYGYMVVATPSQCHIFNATSWTTPHIFDLRAPVHLVVQSERHFVMVDRIAGVQIFSYDGRVLSNPKFPGLRVEFLNAQSLAVSRDCIAILDRTSKKEIRVFDVRTGRSLGGPIKHTSDITSIGLSQFGKSLQDRYCVFVDTNRDLFITTALKSNPVKLLGMVDSCAWNDASDMLLALSDGHMITWLYPAAIFIDKDLTDTAKIDVDAPSFGKLPSLVSFVGDKVTVRKMDGALVSSNVTVYPPLLYSSVANGRWEDAVRLCRFVKTPSLSPALWAAIAAMAIQAKHLDTAEIALAALGEVDKLHFVLHIKDIPSAEGRNAELALYRRAPEEAEQILLQASPPLVYRAIKMNIRLFRWERALDLALQHKTHLDTVIAYRQRHLTQTNRREEIQRFIQYSAEVTVDWDKIRAKKKAEVDKERGRSGPVEPTRDAAEDDDARSFGRPAGGDRSGRASPEYGGIGDGAVSPSEGGGGGGMGGGMGYGDLPYEDEGKEGGLDY